MLKDILNSFIAITFYIIAVDAALSHIKINFKRQEMWIPVLLGPLVVIGEILYIGLDNDYTKFFVIFTLSLNFISGLIGAYYHFTAKEYSTMSFDKKLIFGPPVFAALQISGISILGVIFILFL